ncbi:hypothetical protein BDZ94DRAFT_1313885 [Collybia nuda]|uniref:Uncharacterized protein n=1 Tax=Collybia nuda TaxID=64659 RepID=A0A9P5XWC0_9AGAR|nr:hypothetical protein BDZ94DRAFT_1313885 [Collybia nuda]
MNIQPYNLCCSGAATPAAPLKTKKKGVLSTLPNVVASRAKVVERPTKDTNHFYSDVVASRPPSPRDVDCPMVRENSNPSVAVPARAHSLNVSASPCQEAGVTVSLFLSLSYLILYYLTFRLSFSPTSSFPPFHSY